MIVVGLLPAVFLLLWLFFMLPTWIYHKNVYVWGARRRGHAVPSPLELDAFARKRQLFAHIGWKLALFTMFLL
jgi:hypothetical protein